MKPSEVCAKRVYDLDYVTGALPQRTALKHVAGVIAEHTQCDVMLLMIDDLQCRLNRIDNGEVLNRAHLLLERFPD